MSGSNMLCLGLTNGPIKCTGDNSAALFSFASEGGGQESAPLQCLPPTCEVPRSSSTQRKSVDLPWALHNGL